VNGTTGDDGDDGPAAALVEKVGDDVLRALHHLYLALAPGADAAAADIVRGLAGGGADAADAAGADGHGDGGGDSDALALAGFDFALIPITPRAAPRVPPFYFDRAVLAGALGL
jgi:hypothetical protein